MVVSIVVVLEVLLHILAIAFHVVIVVALVVVVVVAVAVVVASMLILIDLSIVDVLNLAVGSGIGILNSSLQSKVSSLS